MNECITIYLLILLFMNMGPLHLNIIDADAANASDDVLKCMVMRAHISVQEYNELPIAR